MDNNLDSMRNTIAYHEFGHHVHQMKYVTSTTNDANYGSLYGENRFYS
jgi:hypothetical protein